jgi:hypothetical protein
VGLEGASASGAIPELGSFRKIVSEGWGGLASLVGAGGLASLAGPGAGGRGSGDWLAALAGAGGGSGWRRSESRRWSSFRARW